MTWILDSFSSPTNGTRFNSDPIFFFPFLCSKFICMLFTLVWEICYWQGYVTYRNVTRLRCIFSHSICCFISLYISVLVSSVRNSCLIFSVTCILGLVSACIELRELEPMTIFYNFLLLISKRAYLIRKVSTVKIVVSEVI